MEGQAWRGSELLEMSIQRAGDCTVDLLEIGRACELDMLNGESGPAYLPPNPGLELPDLVATLISQKQDTAYVRAPSACAIGPTSTFSDFSAATRSALPIQDTNIRMPEGL
jgi:hypothetical protein